MPDLCIDCHSEFADKVAGVKVPHKPLQQEGGCGNCHAAHYSKARGCYRPTKRVFVSVPRPDDLGKPPSGTSRKSWKGRNSSMARSGTGVQGVPQSPRLEFLPDAPGELPLRLLCFLPGRHVRRLPDLP